MLRSFATIMVDGCDNVSFVFETRYILQQSDQRLAISGSLPILGNWSITTAVIAKEIPLKSGRWLAAVELPRNSSFEWKWVVMAKDRSKAFRWEERPNRSMSTGRYPTHVRSVWNLGEESEVPLKHKFKQKGTVNPDAEDEEEWSYLPSQELLQLLSEGNREDSVEKNSSTNKQKQINNNSYQPIKSKSYENLLVETSKNTESEDFSDENIVNEPKTLKYFAEENLKKEEDKSIASKSLLKRIQEVFCTIL